jgi:zinc transport system substrate-binding protein
MLLWSAAVCSLPAEDGGALSVFVSIPPQAWVVRRVAGEAARVGTLVSKGQDPHTFDPTPLQVQQLAGARIYFTIGLPFEKTLEAKLRGAGAAMEFVDCSAGVKRRSLLAGEGEHGHGEGAEHGGEDDPHVWLSTSNLTVMASNVARALARAAPARAGVFEANRAAFAAELASLRAKLSEELAGQRGSDFYVYHPAFGYFGDEFGLRQKAVEAEGKSPTPRQLAALVERARRDGVKLIIVQPQFNRKTAEVVAGAVGAAVVAVDPVAEDVGDTLGRLVRSLRAARAGGGGRE